MGILTDFHAEEVVDRVADGATPRLALPWIAQPSAALFLGICGPLARLGALDGAAQSPSETSVSGGGRAHRLH